MQCRPLLLRLNCRARMKKLLVVRNAQKITEYIKSYPYCQKDRARRHKQYGHLSPFKLPYAPWQLIAMDFITDLSLSKGCNVL